MHPWPACSKPFRAILTLLVLLVTAHCGGRGTTFVAGGGPGIGSPVKPPVDTGRPSEDSEGIPGYLVEPRRITVTRSRLDHRVQIKAPPGSVVAEQGDVRQVLVSIWSVSASRLAAAQPKNGSELSVAATPSWFLHPTSEGAFEAGFESSETETWVISTQTEVRSRHLLVSKVPADKPRAAYWNPFLTQPPAPLLFEDLPLQLPGALTEGVANLWKPVSSVGHPASCQNYEAGAVSQDGLAFTVCLQDSDRGGSGGYFYELGQDSWRPAQGSGFLSLAAGRFVNGKGVVLEDAVLVWNGDAASKEAFLFSPLEAAPTAIPEPLLLKSERPSYPVPMASSGSQVFIWGGEGLVGHLGQILGHGQIFDAKTRAWSVMATVGAPTPRARHAMVWGGGRVWIWGGALDRHQTTNTGASYDPTTHTWKSLTTVNAPAGRMSPVALWADNKLWIWGGVTATPAQSLRGGIYDPAEERWSSWEGDASLTGIWDGCVVGRHLIFAAQGTSPEGHHTLRAITFDLTTQRFSTASEMRFPPTHAGTGLVCLPEHILVIASVASNDPSVTRAMAILSPPH